VANFRPSKQATKTGRLSYAAYNGSMPEATPNNPPFTFETGLQQLEAIVKEMEGGDLPLERALELFESGMKLSEACRKQLEEAETRIEILTRRAGEIQPQSFGNEK
jgi:exodeoxyribonuclease VII small subunit